MGMGRVLIIGWDGASYDLLGPWAADGELPNFAALLSRGVSGNLMSVLPILSPAAWTTIITGVMPETHGIFGFVRAKSASGQPATASSEHRRCPALWHYLGEASLESAFLWVPATYPPEPIRGVMVTGMGTPGIYADFTHPPGVKRELLDTFGSAVIEPGLAGRGREEYVRALAESVAVQGKAAEHILRTSAPDLAMVAFTQCDSVQHFFWADMERAAKREAGGELGSAILRIYKELDLVLGNLLSLMGPDDLILLISDHGARPIRKEVCVDLLLEHLGLLSFAGGQGGGSGRRRAAARRALTRALSSASRGIQDHCTESVVTILQKLTDSGPLGRLRLAANRSWSGELDYARTVLYPLDGSGALYGAQGAAYTTDGGVVHPEDELLSKLASFRDSETGDPVVRSVTRIGSRDETVRAPLFAIEWADGYFGALWRGGEREIIRNPSDWRGARGGHELSCYHSMEGVLVAAGPTIQPGTNVAGAHLIDIAPTVLEFLGVDRPQRMQGKPLWSSGSSPFYCDIASSSSL